MKICYFLAYLYHLCKRNLFRRKGNWHSSKFEHHHKKKNHYKGLLAITAIVLFIYTQPVIADLLTEQDQTIAVADKLLQSTVKLTTDAWQSGSGFFITPNIILTNEHVIRYGSTVRVTRYNGDTCTGDIGYRDEFNDLALITVTCTGEPLTLQTSAKVGQSVIVAGNPSYFDFSVSKGIVSAKRSDNLQIDAHINFGSSGGIVGNLQGEVIAMVSRKSANDKYIGYAITASKIEIFLKEAKVWP